MTEHEKSIIETILADVGLESLSIGADGNDSKAKPVIAQKHQVGSGYQRI
jgi:hypothetical protein